MNFRQKRRNIMSKTTAISSLIFLLVISTLIFPPRTHADQYYLHYAGNCFMPRLAALTYYKEAALSYMYHDDTNDAAYMCPVDFNVPDGSVYFIKSIGIRFLDNLSDGYIHVELRRQNLYTGTVAYVAEWNSGGPAAAPSSQTASQGTRAGYKLLDTKKFAYWLFVEFYKTGAENPGLSLRLFQIRVHYGT
jgi:hypothetical protein